MHEICNKCELQNGCWSYKKWCERHMLNTEYYQEWKLEQEMYEK
jgi:hypothetical protein